MTTTVVELPGELDVVSLQTKESNGVYRQVLHVRDYAVKEQTGRWTFVLHCGARVGATRCYRGARGETRARMCPSCFGGAK